MRHNEYLLNSSDGTRIYAQCWLTDDKPKANLILIHGLGEHSGRYNIWAELFANQGYHVFAMDNRGHGQSGGKRGHTSFNKLIEDIDLVYEQVTRTFPDIPIILYGHSLGGSLIINYTIRKNPAIAGLITVSPWLVLNYEPDFFKLHLGKIINKVYPSFTMHSGIRAEDLEGENPVINHRDKDPLLHDKISVKLYFDAQELGRFALKNIYKINVPFLLMYGEKDKITSARACKPFVSNTSDKTQLIVWEGFNHNMHNEPDHKVIFSYLLSWLDEKCLKNNAKKTVNELVKNGN